VGLAAVKFVLPASSPALREARDWSVEQPSRAISITNRDGLGPDPVGATGLPCFALIEPSLSNPVTMIAIAHPSTPVDLAS
jgi:hypothetical protein